jgi:lauroyl/myristoyl acyltransferase
LEIDFNSWVCTLFSGVMAGNFKHNLIALRFRLFRLLEQALPVPVLYWMFRPFASLHVALRKPPRTPAIPAIIGGQAAAPSLLARVDSHLNCKLEFFPDRLKNERWLDRCRFEGFDPVRLARREGRPVVMAVCHFGPWPLVRSWVQAMGLPASALVTGQAQARSYLRRLKDSVTLFPEVPTVFHLDELREMTRFLAGGNLLFVAIDQGGGRQMEVEVAEGWRFRMATGAVRLAMRHGAELVSCCVIDEGGWRFRVCAGRPVPRELLAPNSDPAGAGAHLIREMLPLFRQYPEQCSGQLLRRFRSGHVTAGRVASTVPIAA